MCFKYQSIYSGNQTEKSLWHIFITGTDIKPFAFTEFHGTISEGESKVDKIRNSLWGKMYGDLYQLGFNSPSLTVQMYSEVDWDKFWDKNWIVKPFEKILLDHIELKTITT